MLNFYSKPSVKTNVLQSYSVRLQATGEPPAPLPLIPECNGQSCAQDLGGISCTMVNGYLDSQILARFSLPGLEEPSCIMTIERTGYPDPVPFQSEDCNISPVTTCDGESVWEIECVFPSNYVCSGGFGEYSFVESLNVICNDETSEDCSW